MNDHDRDNLRFLMTIPKESFNEWLDQASEDDVQYALEIIKTAKAEMMVDKYDMMDIASTYDDDMLQAKAVIEVIMRK
jgi:hypothetical protein